MRTLGVDLASQAADTAICEVVWGGGRATALPPRVGITDQEILNHADCCDAIGIDAPFGWPKPFVEFLSRGRSQRQLTPHWSPQLRDSLRFRATDVRVKEVLGRWPLSVSSDLISVTAMRCAGLLDRLEVTDPSGDRQTFEVYPAAALAAWGLPSRGYKGGKGVERRLRILEALAAEHPWLTIAPEVKEACILRDHSLDALISSLVARAAAIGLTQRPTSSESALAKVEGWICVPLPGSLGRLPDRDAI